MQYLALMINNSDRPADDKQWSSFFSLAEQSGIFRGGSATDDPIDCGKAYDATNKVVGFMRFEAEDLEQVKDLLAHHPVVLNGGTVRLLRCPKD